MLRPVLSITFKDHDDYYLEIDSVNSVEIERSRKNLTTTCKISLPRKLKVFNSKDGVYVDINTFIKRGTRVEVKLGYHPIFKNEFTGYVARVNAKIPFDIFCEDEMWNLKQNTFTKAWAKVGLKELIAFVYPGKARLADLQLGGFVIKDQSTAQVLDALKKFGLQCYFDIDGVLVADFAGATNLRPVEVVYDFHKNIIDNDLEYTRKEDIRIRCKGISKLPTGKKLEFFYGDKDGDLRTLNYINLDQEDLEKIVKKEIDKLKQDGFKNGFTTFGVTILRTR